MIQVEDCLGPYKNYCDGYQNPGASGNGYVLGLALSVGKAKSYLHHRGSSILDKINAFDRAEAEDTYLGQINMITVSSFCGPNGLVFGYDILRPRKLFKAHPLLTENKIGNIPVYSAEPLLHATRALFGTKKSKKFPIIPGSHTPCAERSIEEFGPKHLYCAFALGIPKDRNKNACLMMEDVGIIKSQIERTKRIILKNVARGIVAVGENQDIEYKEIFLELKDIKVKRGEVGCALFAAPYFTLARKIAPRKYLQNLSKMNLEDWTDSP